MNRDQALQRELEAMYRREIIWIIRWIDPAWYFYLRDRRKWIWRNI